MLDVARWKTQGLTSSPHIQPKWDIANIFKKEESWEIAHASLVWSVPAEKKSDQLHLELTGISREFPTVLLQRSWLLAWCWVVCLVRAPSAVL